MLKRCHVQVGLGRRLQWKIVSLRGRPNSNGILPQSVSKGVFEWLLKSLSAVKPYEIVFTISASDLVAHGSLRGLQCSATQGQGGRKLPSAYRHHQDELPGVQSRPQPYRTDLWDELGRRVKKNHPPPRDRQDLLQMLQLEWQGIPGHQNTCELNGEPLCGMSRQWRRPHPLLK